MKIWILGAQGVLGKELVALCQEKQIAYHASGRQEGDITSLDALLSLASAIAPTHVINCAAFTDVDLAESVPDRVFAVNATGAGHVAQAALSVGAKLLHLSTDYVFDGNHRTPYVETDVCAPVNCYGKSKWEGEKLVAAQLPTACILRASWFFGRTGRNFFSSLLEKIQTQEVISVVCDQWSGPTCYRDLAQTILDMLDAEGIFHFCNSGGASRDAIAREILSMAREAGMSVCCTRIDSVPSSAFASRAIRPHYSLLDTRKISQFLGKTPRSWQEAFKEYLFDVTSS